MITIKSEREIELLAKAGHIVYLTHQYLAPFIKPGISTEELNRLGEEFIISQGATPSFKGYEGIVNEAEVTGKLVDELAALLEKDRDFIVIRTDRSKTVSERVEMIRNTDASLVLSIHADGSLDPSASGMRNSVMKTRDVHRDDSIRFAQCIANAFSGSLDVHNGTMLYKPLEGGVVSRKDTDLTDTTVYTYDTWSIMDCEKVTVVSDLCYVTCQKDVDTWCHEEGYRKAAGLYYRAIRNYYGLQ